MGGEAADLFLHPSLALGLTGGFLKAALGFGIGVGLGTDGRGQSTLGVDGVRAGEESEGQGGPAEDPKV